MKLLIAMLSCCLLLTAEVKSQSPPSAAPPAVSSSPGIASSLHFVVRTDAGTAPATDVLRLCDTVRGELQRAWGSGLSTESWQPRCEVVVHATRRSYLAAVGQGGSQTTGSSFIQVAAGAVKSRRIDLLSDLHGGLTALPHELTHVILADAFGGIPTPHWIDEGVAMLADTRDKQWLHHRDCQEAIASGADLPLAHLMTLEQFTSPEQMPAFYGQSLSLVRMLAEQGPPQRIVTFGIDARRLGYDRALQDHYGIQGIADLERRWRAYVARTTSAPAKAPIVMVSFQP